MRRIAQLLTIAAALPGSLLIAAGTATAGPAVPYSYSDCTDYGSGYAYCEEGHGVYAANDTPSGNEMGKATGFVSQKLTYNGQVYFQNSNQFNAVFVRSDGDPKVAHYNQKSEFTYSDGSATSGCTSQDNYTYANGEVRHSVYSFQCT